MHSWTGLRMRRCSKVAQSSSLACVDDRSLRAERGIVCARPDFIVELLTSEEHADIAGFLW